MKSWNFKRQKKKITQSINGYQPHLGRQFFSKYWIASKKSTQMHGVFWWRQPWWKYLTVCMRENISNHTKLLLHMPSWNFLASTTSTVMQFHHRLYSEGKFHQMQKSPLNFAGSGLPENVQQKKSRNLRLFAFPRRYMQTRAPQFTLAIGFWIHYKANYKQFGAQFRILQWSNSNKAETRMNSWTCRFYARRAKIERFTLIISKLLAERTWKLGRSEWEKFSFS